MKSVSSAQSSEPVVHIVDDDPGVREGIKTLLDSVSLQSKTYASASEFFASKLSDQASCLVLDVRLPGLSGFDFQTELASRSLTINSDAQIRSRYLQTGFFRWASLPALDRTCKSLHHSIGHALKQSGVPVRL
jgi:DNA-binding NtrC family response regulator